MPGIQNSLRVEWLLLLVAIFMPYPKEPLKLKQAIHATTNLKPMSHKGVGPVSLPGSLPGQG